MNDFECLKRLQKDNLTHVNFGSVFVDRYNTDDAKVHDKCDINIAKVEHSEMYDNWYLPFDISTYFGIASGGGYFETLFGVVFKDNEEHKLGSTMDFVAVLEGIGSASGTFQLINLTDFDSDEKIREYRLNNADKFVALNKVMMANGEYSKYGTLTHIKTVTMRDVVTKKVMDTFRLDSSHRKDPDLVKKTNHFVASALSAFMYFTELLVDTKSFVVEEKIATKKKGKIRQKSGSPSLFHVIDIKTLRTKYFKSTSYGTNGTRECLWRRRHERTFRSDYFKNRKGETIIIEPVWIGPSEYYDPGNNRLYKVRLDVG